jgi:hypothetical protein
MKTYDFYFLILVFITACCDNKETTYKKTNFKTPLVSDFIPKTLNQVTFASDSNKTIVFNQVVTEHNYIEADNCFRGQCCNEKLQYEFKKIIYRSVTDNMTFQLRINSAEYTDLLTLSMTPDFPARQSLYGDADFARDINFEYISNHIDTLEISYLDSIIIQGQTFNKVHLFSGKPITWTDRLYADRIYYSKTEGIIAFRLNNKSTWRKI